jgi:hypothetical protein
MEEQFYLIWPSVVRRVSPAALFNLCIFVIVSLLVVRNVPAVEALSLHWDNLLYRFTPFRIDSLCGGAMLAIVVYRRPNIATLRTPLRINLPDVCRTITLDCSSPPNTPVRLHRRRPGLHFAGWADTLPRHPLQSPLYARSDHHRTL